MTSWLTLQTLTRLHYGFTMPRSAGSPNHCVHSEPGAVEAFDGDQTRTILSQAYTKWIFATSDPDSAQLLERIGGKRKLLRLEETHSQGVTFLGPAIGIAGANCARRRAGHQCDSDQRHE